MEGISKNVKQTPEFIKSTSEVRERQNKTNTLKFVKKIPIGLPLSPKNSKSLMDYSFIGQVTKYLSFRR